MDKITSIEQYIKRINEIALNNKNKVILYRGEPKDYKDTACIPNIFRNNYVDINPFFEKNILDEMTANHISVGNNYLEKAINAQHDGFPSRFLDVSYNCLVALHFAVTPHYKKNIDYHDKEDGKVYVYLFNDFFCPTGDGIVQNYDAIIKNNVQWYTNNPLFKNNYKVVDHIKINERIKAQNGAFILFQGNTRIPKEMFIDLTIDQKAKEKIRRELKTLFDIDNSTMYPEPSNLVDSLVAKSKLADNSEFTIENEVTLALSILNIKTDELIQQIMAEEKDNKKNMYIREIERYFLHFRNCLEILNKTLGNKVFLDKFNSFISEKYNFLEKYKSEDFTFAKDQIIFKGEKHES